MTNIEDREYEVDRLTEIRRRKSSNGYSGLRVRVIWKGYSEKEGTWEPIENLEPSSGISLLKEFLEKLERKPGQRKLVREALQILEDKRKEKSSEDSNSSKNSTFHISIEEMSEFENHENFLNEGSEDEWLSISELLEDERAHSAIVPKIVYSDILIDEGDEKRVLIKKKLIDPSSRRVILSEKIDIWTEFSLNESSKEAILRAALRKMNDLEKIFSHYVSSLRALLPKKG